MTTEHVRIYEMGPRDGLQNEKLHVPAIDKIRMIDLLSETGLSNIEVTSFVSPKWIPQLADAAIVLAGIKRKPGVKYSALTPNLKGYEGAKLSNVDEIGVFVSASETFSIKNTNCSISESLERLKLVTKMANQDRIAIRGYVSCVVACPYEGQVQPEKVANAVKILLDMGCYEVSLGDTIGSGTPETIQAMLKAVLNMAPADRLASHYHDTGNNSLVNIEASLELGIRTVDTSIGGLGGCPYAPGAKGNAATGPVVRWLEQNGYHTGINVSKLMEAEAFVAEMLNGCRK